MNTSKGDFEISVGDTNMRFVIWTGAMTLNGQLIELTTLESKLIRILAQHRDKVTPSFLILKTLYPTKVAYPPKILEVLMSKIRTKMNKVVQGSGDALIKTVHGRGYMWPQVQAMEPLANVVPFQARMTESRREAIVKEIRKYNLARSQVMDYYLMIPEELEHWETLYNQEYGIKRAA